MMATAMMIATRYTTLPRLLGTKKALYGGMRFSQLTGMQPRRLF